ncbi:MAG: hypothetical protein ACFBSF_06090 [Leptolyngbyaceae cyanobacterium]
MLEKMHERYIHQMRWGLTTGWLLLILSLFYDPWSSWMTDSNNTISPLRIQLQDCVLVQGVCLRETPYALGAPIFWGLIIPGTIFILLVFGHEFWRRICPLSFLSQIPRALGWQRTRKRTDTRTGRIWYETVKVGKKSWLARHHFYLQFGLFYLGLCSRILFINSERLVLGLFLSGTILTAIAVGYLYDGKSWCHYFCPMAPVQRIYGEPRGLLNSTAHEEENLQITQSMCREVSPTGQESGACVGCQSPCLDIDAERAYWETINQPKQRLLYYGYVGLVLGYFTYYYLYAGNWEYYLSGVWAHEAQLATLWDPGFYIGETPLWIPKIIAVPLTLAIFSLGGYAIGCRLEKRYQIYQKRHHKNWNLDYIRHRMFTLCTFFAFNFFFIFAGRNFLRLLPIYMRCFFPMLIAVCSTLWLYRTWQRSPTLYLREKLLIRLRRQLSQLHLDTPRLLAGRTLNDLNASEIYVLAKILPGFVKDSPTHDVGNKT